MTTPLHSVSVAGVTLNNEGQVLIMKRRDNGQWQAPGGVLELDETVEAGVIREVYEETGVLVGVERLTGIYKNLSAGVLALVYRCHPLGGTPDSSAESSESRWLPVNVAMDLMNPVFAIRVKDAIAVDGTTAASRNHDGVKMISFDDGFPREGHQ